MILSETTWRYKQPILSAAIVPIKEMQRATGAVYNNRAVKDSSHFLISALCEYKALTAVALLLIFQFALYDFDINEYSSNNQHGAYTSLVQSA
jgi:hypothetical protein